MMDMAAARYYTVRRLKMEAIIEMGLVGRPQKLKLFRRHMLNASISKCTFDMYTRL